MTTPRPVLRVCVTGPESTGKTTLAGRLAQHAGGIVAAEASRAYAERKVTPLDASDVVPIGREQAALGDAAIEEARRRGALVTVFDTDLWSTVVYAGHYYGDVPTEVALAARERTSDLYLLCDVDVPWIPDGIRDRPTDREAMFARFHEILVAEGISPVRVAGSWEERWRIAVGAVEAAIRVRGGEDR